MSESINTEYKKPGFFSISLFRGVLFLIPGLLIGMGIVSGVRLLMGLPAWSSNAAWTLGGMSPNTLRRRNLREWQNT
jgi:hypothetical protein